MDLGVGLGVRVEVDVDANVDMVELGVRVPNPYPGSILHNRNGGCSFHVEGEFQMDGDNTDFQVDQGVESEEVQLSRFHDLVLPSPETRATICRAQTARQVIVLPARLLSHLLLLAETTT